VEMARDGLLYVLTHRSSDGTLIDRYFKNLGFENDWDPFLIADFFEILRLRSRHSSKWTWRRRGTSEIAKSQRQMSLNGSGDIAV